MGKHLDAVKPVDEFRAPWETEGGTDADIDKPKLKRWIHGILTDKAKAQDARDEASEALETAKTDLQAAKDEAANANGPEAQKKIDALQAKVDKLEGEARDRKEADAHEQLRKDVLGDLDPKYAKYVVGKTQEELEASLEDVKKDFGLDDEPSGDDDDDDEPPARHTPRSRLRNVTDPKVDKGEATYDPEKVADEILSGGLVFH